MLTNTVRNGLGYKARQGSGYPDWVVVRGAERMFDWYDEENTTELRFDTVEGTVHLAVDDRTRRVFRYQYSDGRVANLYNVDGLVRHFYGSNAYGHTEWFVAVD